MQETWENTISIPGSGRSSGGGNGNPLQYSCQKNPMDRVAWQATAHGVAKSQTLAPTHIGLGSTLVIFLEPDILECKVKWALESITASKASGSDRIPVGLFQILKDDAGKVLHSICQQIWKTQQWPQDWKRSVFIPIPKKGNAKECSNYCTIALISLVK